MYLIKGAVELVDLIVWSLAHHRTFDDLVILSNLCEATVKRFHSGLVLQVGLAIQIFCFYIAHALRIRALYEDHVGGQELIA